MKNPTQRDMNVSPTFKRDMHSLTQTPDCHKPQGNCTCYFKCDQHFLAGSA
jgi:hypothetical protein